MTDGQPQAPAVINLKIPARYPCHSFCCRQLSGAAVLYGSGQYFRSAGAVFIHQYGQVRKWGGSFTETSTVSLPCRSSAGPADRAAPVPRQLPARQKRTARVAPQVHNQSVRQLQRRIFRTLRNSSGVFSVKPIISITATLSFINPLTVNISIISLIITAVCGLPSRR